MILQQARQGSLSPFGPHLGRGREFSPDLNQIICSRLGWSLHDPGNKREGTFKPIDQTITVGRDLFGQSVTGQRRALERLAISPTDPISYDIPSKKKVIGPHRFDISGRPGERIAFILIQIAWRTIIEGNRGMK
jgi:hypothetical protein